jgi:carboxyl-terminal processing protease
MRAMTIAAGLLIAVLPAVRAGHPGDNSSRAPSEFVRAQAVTYSSQMRAVFQLIEGNFMWPASKLEFEQAAAVVLFLPASGPIPASLWTESAIFQFIQDHYVRPDQRIRLARAALVGLYEAAREPIPASLWSEIGQARKPGQIAYLLESARERLGDLDALRDQKAVYASLTALSSALDPFSGLPPADRRSDSRSDTEGVGLEFEWNPTIEERKVGEPPDDAPQQRSYDKPTGPVRVSEVLPGGPAQRAGIRPGDILTHINDYPIESPSALMLFPHLFTSSEGLEKLRLTFERPGVEQPIHSELVATTFNPETVFGVRRRLDNAWDFMLDRQRRIGYLRLGFIDGTRADPRTANEMEAAISQLKGAGMKGLIFDLRGCPGGFLEPAKAISGMFIKSGLIANLDDRSEENEGRPRHQQFRIDNGSGILEGIVTIVLIDEQTRGGGEMVAAVLQDHRVARMAGQRTFGKGSVQKSYPISEAGGVTLWLTTGLFTRPNGKRLQRLPGNRDEDDWGISPNPGLEYPVSPELSKLVKIWMKQQVLRPGDGLEPLPLDDPENDPLREFARRELVKQIK